MAMPYETSRRDRPDPRDPRDPRHLRYLRQLRAWRARLIGLFGGGRRERQLADFAQEIESHLQMHVDDNLRAGMTPEQARRRARLALGGIAATTEAYRDRQTLPRVEHAWRDVAFAIRQLRRSPGFTSTALLVLATGSA